MVFLLYIFYSPPKKLTNFFIGLNLKQQIPPSKNIFKEGQYKCTRRALREGKNYNFNEENKGEWCLSFLFKYKFFFIFGWPK